MAGTNWDGIFTKVESSPLDRFKNKNRILKTFGPPGVRVYDALDGQRSARSVQETLGIDASLFERILAQLMADSAIRMQDTGVSGEIRPAPEQPSDMGSQTQQESSDASSSTSSSSNSINPLPPPDWPPASRQPSVSPSPPSYPSSARPPLTPPASGRPGPSERRYPSERGNLSSPPPNLPDSSSEAESAPRPASESSGASPSFPEGSEASPSPPSSPAGRTNLSPLEKLISDKYGPVGLKVYELIDGERTAEDILNETGLSESKLVEILEFMNEQGIIKLDRPLRAPPSGSAPGPSMGGGIGGAPGDPARPPMGGPAGASRSSDDNLGFKPMVESGDENQEEGALSPDALPVDVPVPPARLSLLQKAKMMAILSTKHGKVGNDLMGHVDGTKDFVQLAVETGLALHDLDLILGDLGKAGLLTFKPLTRTEVRHRYGDDGLAIYKRFGRDGVLIYQMIGKVESLRDIVKSSQIEPQRAVDILIFVHRVLGLELPVDRDMIFRYLTKG